MYATACVQFRGCRSDELLHLPDEPAGVGRKADAGALAGELLHLPDEPAGVGQQVTESGTSRR
jgi:hypothetical protein